MADGFTLIEALLVVATSVVLAVVTVPILAGAIDRYYILSAGQQVASTIRAARFQAVARNSNVRIRHDFPAADQYQTEIEDPDTMVWGALGDAQNLPTGVTFADDSDDIQVEPSGRAPGCAPCTIVVTNGDEEDDRTITVSTSGRVRLQ